MIIPGALAPKVKTMEPTRRGVTENQEKNFKNAYMSLVFKTESDERPVKKD